jgi:hypothetical protein
MGNFDIFLGAAAVTTICMAFIAFLLFCFWAWMIIDCINNDKLTDSAKPIWLIVIAIANIIGAIAYYFSVVKKDKENKISLKIANVLFFAIFTTGLCFSMFIVFLGVYSKGKLAEKSIIAFNQNKVIEIPRYKKQMTIQPETKNINKNIIADNKLNGGISKESIRKAKSRNIYGEFIEIGRWKRNENIEEKYIVLLNYSGRTILIELFGNGMQVEYEIKETDIGDVVIYEFKNKQIKEYYVVDNKGNLYIKNCVFKSTFEKA